MSLEKKATPLGKERTPPPTILFARLKLDVVRSDFFCTSAFFFFVDKREEEEEDSATIPPPQPPLCLFFTANSPVVAVVLNDGYLSFNIP